MKRMSQAKMRRYFRRYLPYILVTAAFLVCQALISTGIMPRTTKSLLIPVCVYIVMAVSLNLTVGISGELSLGHAGFMSIGAFSGIVTSAYLGTVFAAPDGVRLLAAILIGGVFAGAMGVLIGIPVLRLQGDYLAIVTLAFGEIIRNVLNCVYISLEEGKLRFSFNDPNLSGTMLFRGPTGATGVERIATFTAGFLLVLFTLTVVLNLIHSRSGRAIMAIRDNRIAAESVGIPVTAFRLKAFVVSAFLAGMAGALFGLNFSSVAASKFNFNTSINILVFVVLGGMGNILGSVISATVLYVLPEAMRALEDYRMILYAVVLIVVMLCTWSPKFKGAFQALPEILREKLGGKKGREAGSHE